MSGIKLSNIAEELASMVAVSGEEVEAIARAHNVDQEELA